MAEANENASRVVTRQYLYPFNLVTSLFALWGFADDVTNPLVRAFKEIFLSSRFICTFFLKYINPGALLGILAIVGGAFMPRMQGALIDGDGITLFGRALESVRVSFFLPVICFVIIAVYGFLSNFFERKSRPGSNPTH